MGLQNEILTIGDLAALLKMKRSQGNDLVQDSQSQVHPMGWT